MAIISLTSIPPRFPGLGPVLGSLLAQTGPVDEIRLHIPRAYRRFPDWSGALPDLPQGVTLVRVEEDFGPASKVLHATRALEGRDVPILFCDDDRIYPPDWSLGLLDAHAARRDACIAVIGRQLSDVLPEAPRLTAPDRAVISRHTDLRYRLQRLRQHWQQRSLHPSGPKPARRPVGRAGRVDLLQGFGGAVMLPRFVDAAFYDIPQDVWMVDDIWLSGHLARRGIPIWLPRRQAVCRRASNDGVEALRDTLFDGADRDGSNRRAIDWFRRTYGIWGGPQAIR